MVYFLINFHVCVANKRFLLKYLSIEVSLLKFVSIVEKSDALNNSNLLIFN